MQNDPIAIIKNDHKEVEALFKEYEDLGDTAAVSKRKTVDAIINLLSVHAEMEEAVCYPVFKDVFNKEDDKMVDEAYVEHAGAKRLLEDLKTLEPDQPEFDASVKVLMEQIRHHVKEEENELLPEVKKEVPEETLEVMGADMLAFKKDRGG